VTPLRQRYRTSAAIRLQTILQNEFSRRRLVNPRYSLRAFARSVEIEHSTLSQLLRGKRTMTWKSIQQIARTMRWLGGSINLQLQAQPQRPFDSRLIAHSLKVSVDEVNVALTDLCLFGLMELKGE
jgi:plasmid maintenance system antidote protein VapI